MRQYAAPRQETLARQGDKFDHRLMRSREEFRQKPSLRRRARTGYARRHPDGLTFGVTSQGFHAQANDLLAPSRAVSISRIFEISPVGAEDPRTDRKFIGAQHQDCVFKFTRELQRVPFSTRRADRLRIRMDRFGRPLKNDGCGSFSLD